MSARIRLAFALLAAPALAACGGDGPVLPAAEEAAAAVPLDLSYGERAGLRALVQGARTRLPAEAQALDAPLARLSEGLARNDARTAWDGVLRTRAAVGALPAAVAGPLQHMGFADVLSHVESGIPSRLRDEGGGFNQAR